MYVNASNSEELTSSIFRVKVSGMKLCWICAHLPYNLPVYSDCILSVLIFILNTCSCQVLVSTCSTDN